jgi:catechol 2,3-dioxygenase-like lactoylglutathione lyase family enzyme
MAAMEARQVLETSLYVDDLRAAEEFYCRVLGLKLITRLQGRHVFFHCGEGVLLLFNPDATQAPPGEIPTHGAKGPGHVAFAMREAEIPGWREHLQRHGVEIEVETTWPSGGRSIYFRDPAGNSLELATPKTWNLEEAHD